MLSRNLRTAAVDLPGVGSRDVPLIGYRPLQPDTQRPCDGSSKIRDPKQSDTTQVRATKCIVQPSSQAYERSHRNGQCLYVKMHSASSELFRSLHRSELWLAKSSQHSRLGGGGGCCYGHMKQKIFFILLHLIFKKGGRS